MEITDQLADKLEAIVDAKLLDGGRAPYSHWDTLAENHEFGSQIELIFCWAFLCSPINDNGLNAFVAGSQGPRTVEAAYKWLNLFCETCGCTLLFGPDYKAVVLPQTQIGEFRVDFLIVGRDYYGHPDADSPPIAFIVECDGHDFHERTKQQAARDKRRDRKLQTMGLPILRFTGSELWNNPADCAEQAWDMLRHSIRRVSPHHG